MAISYSLAAQKRTVLGKQVKKLRREGWVPAELFGPGSENVHISVSLKEFMKVYEEAGRSALIDLKIEGEKEAVPILVQHVQMHPLSHEPMAIDLYRIQKGKKITTEIPLEFVGESPMDGKEGYAVMKSLYEIPVEVLPKDIPHNIEVDLTTLKNPDDVLHIQDLKLPEGVEVELPPDTVIVRVAEQREEESEPEPTTATEDLEELSESEPETPKETTETEEASA